MMLPVPVKLTIPIHHPTLPQPQPACLELTYMTGRSGKCDHVVLSDII